MGGPERLLPGLVSSLGPRWRTEKSMCPFPVPFPVPKSAPKPVSEFFCVFVCGALHPIERIGTGRHASRAGTAVPQGEKDLGCSPESRAISEGCRGRLPQQAEPSQALSMQDTKQRNCLNDGIVFRPRRVDQFFCSTRCARQHRIHRLGPLPGRRAYVQPGAVASFHEGMRRAKPPRKAIGYKLYCAELEVWLPLAGSQRWDGSFPKTDYFELWPTEIPRVPLATNYRLAWIYRGGIPQEIAHTIFIDFPQNMRKTGEIGRRVRAYEEQRRALLQAHADPLLLRQHDQRDSDADGEPENDP